MNKIIIYLTNLTHINKKNIPATESIPLNIGFLAAYTKRMLKDEIEIKLFNTPAELVEAVKSKKPHILAGSNYAWNANLSYYYLSYFKRQSPEIITVMGGPTFSYDPARRKEFLSKRKLLDFYISGEGEISFVDLIQTFLESRMDIEKIKAKKIKGCHYFAGENLISGPLPERIKDLDIISSPYLDGFLDKFLDRGFTPILQSNRGCPFSCAYCCSSIDYYNKVNFFSIQRVKAEIEYIAKRVKSPSIHIHDDNFGMFAQDYEICRKFKEVQDKYGWPFFISAATGKNSTERIIRCAELLGSSITFSVSVQTTNEEALRNINRENIHLKDFWVIQQKIKELGLNSNSELILPLPGETLESHLDGIKAIMSFGVDSVCPYTTMLLPSSPLYEEESFDKFEMLVKYRIIPRDFGKYEGENIVETEKVCVGTRNLSFDDYLFLRGFHLIIYCYYNGETFKEFIHYLRSIGVEAYDFCYALLSHINTAPEQVKMMFESFLSDTRKELWDAEDDIYRHYKEDANFNKLLAGEEGYNLLQRYQGLFFTSYFKLFLEYSIKVAIRLLSDKGIEYDREILNSISSYILHSAGRILDIAEESTIAELEYDVYAWRREGFKEPILRYKNKIKLKFSQTDKQKNTIRNYISIYGDTEDAKGKILTRINPKMLFKEVSVVE